MTLNAAMHVVNDAKYLITYTDKANGENSQILLDYTTDGRDSFSESLSEYRALKSRKTSVKFIVYNHAYKCIELIVDVA